MFNSRETYLLHCAILRYVSVLLPIPGYYYAYYYYYYSTTTTSNTCIYCIEGLHSDVIIIIMTGIRLRSY